MYNLSNKYPQAIIDAFESEIKSSHRRRIRIIIRDEAGNVKDEITEILAGEVQVSRQATPNRLLNLELIRPKTRIHPSDLWLTDTWQVLYEVYVSAADTGDLDYHGWVSVPVFAGCLAPGASGLRKSDLDSSRISITCLGYEAVYSSPLGFQRSIPKGMLNSDAVANVLNYYDDFHDHSRIKQLFTQSTARLAKNWFYGSSTLGNSSPISTWAAAKYLTAGCGGYVLFIDADFRAILKPHSSTPVRILSVDEKNIITPPESEVKLDNFCNTYVIWGAKPEGKNQIKGEAYADSPYSPKELKRRWVIEEENDSCGTTDAAKRLAEQRLDDSLKVEMTVQLDALIDPRLQEYDYVQVDYADQSWTVPLMSFNIPLTGGSQQISSARRTIPERIYATRRQRLVKK